MKKLLLITLLFAFWFPSNSQTTTVLLGASPFQDSLWYNDTSTFTITKRVAPFITGFTVTGITGLTEHPVSGTIYAIAKVSGVSGRVLCKYNAATSELTQVGGFGIGGNFSSITFKHDSLLGLTGNGASAPYVPEALYLIDTATAAATILDTLGNGADGEIICYNPFNDLLYHWSGNGTVVYETILPYPPYTVTNIPIIGTTNGETFGAVNISATQFITSNISSSFNRFYTDGTVSAAFSPNPDDLRGLVLVECDRSIVGDTSLCEGDSILLVSKANAINYQWYHDGVLITGATNDSVYVDSSGTYSCDVNDNCGFGIGITNITMFARPTVTVSGDTSFCTGSSASLSGSTGGTSQWYLNGAPIVGANSPNYSATAPGIYNMVKTNSNGCSDSSATGIQVDQLNTPSVNISGSAMYCVGDSTLLTGSSGGTSQWYINGSPISGANSPSIYVLTPGVYNMTKTNLNGCSDSANVGITVVENALPVVVANTGADTICLGDAVILSGSGAQSYVWNNGVADSVSFNPNGTATYIVEGTDSVGCISTDTIEVVVNSVDVTTSLNAETVTANAVGAIYQWIDCNNGNQPIAAETNQSYTATANGDYAVIVTQNGCTDTSACTNIASVGLKNISKSSELISVYPNPSQGKFILKTAGVYDYTVTSLIGEVVNKGKTQKGKSELDLSGFPSGLYFITVIIDNKVSTLKIVKGN